MRLADFKPKYTYQKKAIKGGKGTKLALSIWLFFVMVFGVFISLFSFSGQVLAADHEINIYIYGEPMAFDEVQPIIENGRTLIPFRRLSEKIGVAVTWEAEERQVLARDEEAETELVLTIDSQTAYVNGEAVELDVAPKIHDGRTLIPLRFFNETFGMRVDYDEGNIWLASKRPADTPLENIQGTISGFYALGTGERSSWTELFGAPSPEVGAQAKTHLFTDIHLGWFEISREGELIRSGENYGFQRPTGYENVLDELSEQAIYGNMTIFAHESERELAELLGNTEKRAYLIDDIIEELKQDNYSGINLDIEGLGLTGDDAFIEQVREDYVQFVAELEHRMTENQRLVVTVPPTNSAYDGYVYARLGEVADKLVVMAYDYHDREEPSPTAPIQKVEAGIRTLCTKVPSEKIVLGVRLPAVRYIAVDEEERDEEELKTN